MKRPPRPPRPPFKKSKYSLGWCKRPACRCWTPAGCIGPELTELYNPEGMGPEQRSCFPGPCFSYEACVTHQCISDVGCLVHGILQFWIRQYKAAAVWVDPVLTRATTPAIRAGRQLLGALGAPGGIPTSVGGVPPGAITDGCPPGWYWGIGLTGVACSDPALGRPAATAQQLIAILGYDPRTG